jgi:hypothetical protein
MSWIVYSRPNCTLCTEFLVALADLMGERAASVQVIDIDGDDRLQRLYYDRIPVLAVNGEVVCQYLLDVARVHACLESDS